MRREADAATGTTTTGRPLPCGHGRPRVSALRKQKGATGPGRRIAARAGVRGPRSSGGLLGPARAGRGGRAGRLPIPGPLAKATAPSSNARTRRGASPRRPRAGNGLGPPGRSATTRPRSARRRGNRARTPRSAKRGPRRRRGSAAAGNRTAARGSQSAAGGPSGSEARGRRGTGDAEIGAKGKSASGPRSSAAGPAPIGPGRSRPLAPPLPPALSPGDSATTCGPSPGTAGPAGSAGEARPSRTGIRAPPLADGTGAEIQGPSHGATHRQPQPRKIRHRRAQRAGSRSGDGENVPGTASRDRPERCGRRTFAQAALERKRAGAGTAATRRGSCTPGAPADRSPPRPRCRTAGDFGNLRRKAGSVGGRALAKRCQWRAVPAGAVLRPPRRGAPARTPIFRAMERR